MKIVFLEGLPGVGKTTILQRLREKYPNINTVDELIFNKLFTNSVITQEDFMKNDDIKCIKAQSLNSVVDRGPISTLSYNQVRHIVDENFKFNILLVKKWFNQWLNLINNSIIYYFTNDQNTFSITSQNKNDPYGSIINQKILEYVSLYNCKKYCKNVIIKKYYKNNLEEIVDEIANQFVCT